MIEPRLGGAPTEAARDVAALWDAAPCGLLTTDPDGLITSANATFLAWSGHGHDDIVGRRTFASLLSGGGRIYHETHFAPLLRLEGRVQAIALDVQGPDRTRRPALVSARLEHAPDGTVRRVHVAVFDAAERRAYERELLEERHRAEASEARATLLARTLQESFIPPAPPVVPHLEVAAAYRPAGDGTLVGGDFYDVIEVGEDDWVVAVGDVCGKGAAAAVVTATVRHTIRAAVVRHADADAVLSVVNEVLLRGDGRFCTAVLMRLRRRAGAWSVSTAVAGHPQPLLLRPGAAARPIGAPGRLLGVVAGTHWTAPGEPLAPGDLVVAFTDGITEARQGHELFGEERLASSVERHGRSAPAAVAGLLEDARAWAGDAPRDDVVVVALRVPTS